MILPPRECELLAMLRREGPASRWTIHERTGMRPNTVGSLVGSMLRRGVVREGLARSEGPGRPRVPVEIDPETRGVLGLSIEPEEVGLIHLNLRGEPRGPVARRRARPGRSMVSLARELLTQHAGNDALAIGVAVSGLIDPANRAILLSSALPGQTGVSLEPIYRAAGSTPLVLDNDMHALSANWLLAHDPDPEPAEDVMLVSFRDGAIGASVIIDGKPNRGCVVGGNELGHTRLPVQTDTCHCGRVGCLERICTSSFLRRRGLADISLDQAVAADAPAPAMQEMTDLLAMGLANAVNFIRPGRLVLVSPLVQNAGFRGRLIRAIQADVLPTLAGRVRIEVWDQPLGNFTEAAGWLALASLYREKWTSGVGAP